MKFETHLNNLADDKRSPNGLTPADMVALSHYPSLDKLFHEPDLAALATMTKKLEQTFQNIERIVLRASVEESKRAKTAAEAVRNALDFLQVIKKMRDDKIDS